jgi:hypothetical protein
VDKWINKGMRGKRGKTWQFTRCVLFSFFLPISVGELPAFGYRDTKRPNAHHWSVETDSWLLATFTHRQRQEGIRHTVPPEGLPWRTEGIIRDMGSRHCSNKKLDEIDLFGSFSGLL